MKYFFNYINLKHQNRQVLIIFQQEIISPSLTWIFNLSIKTEIYVEWNLCRILPIFKTEDKQNYRPISILPISYW
jgi:hypothetical protein